ncbi:MAG TPA: hypothetical protein VFM50_06380 [Nocardioidaceae bacterium]|nr:hypothetical protein [Nocardioidaceae bacterium]
MWSRPGIVLGTALVTVTGVSTAAAVVFDDGTDSRTSASRVPTELRTGAGFSSNLSRGATARPSLHLDTTEPGQVAVSDPADVLSSLGEGPPAPTREHPGATQRPESAPEPGGATTDDPGTASPRTPDSSPHAPTAPTADASDRPAPTTSADRTAPHTTTLSPSAQDGRWVATFSADEPASFRCWLDGVPLGSCSSPLALGPLAVGEHGLRVVATDDAGNQGAPARTKWTIPPSPTGSPPTASESPTDPPADSPPTASESPAASPSTSDSSPADPSSPAASSMTPSADGDPTQTGSPPEDSGGEPEDGTDDESSSEGEGSSGSSLLSPVLG